MEVGPYTPNDVENGGTPTLSLPTWLGGSGFAIGDHPFGQDEIGRDIFARVMKGTQTSLNVMIVISLLAAVIGMAIGAVAGYFRGGIDQFLMRFTDLFITFPVIVIGAVLGKFAGEAGAFWLAVALGLHHLDDAGATGARRVPDPARARVRGRREGGRREQHSASSAST